MLRNVGDLAMTRLTLFITLAVITAAPPVIAQPPQDPALVAHYTFEEGPGGPVKDWSGNGNDGTNRGAGYVALPEGKGVALSFDASDAYVDCGSQPSLDLADAFSIELWLFPETRPAKGEAGLVGKGYDSYLLTYTNGPCWFYVTTGPEGRRDRTDCRARADILGWRHIVATFDGENVRIYSDGKLRDNRKSKSPKVNTVEGNLYLRYPVVWGDKVDPPFRCMMDDVRIYSRALSEDEVARHYSQEVPERPDIPWFEGPKLDCRILAPTSTLVVTADLSLMVLRPAGSVSALDWNLETGAPSSPTPSPLSAAVLSLELREPNHGNIVARHEEPGLPDSGMIDCPMSVDGIPPGEYDLRATIVHNGVRIGLPSSTKVNLSIQKPPWAAAYDDVKILNNLVAELLNLRATQKEADGAYAFTNPRDGWIFISSTALTRGTDKVLLSLDSPAPENAAITHTSQTADTLDTMRLLPAGNHTLHVRCEGKARPTALVVRAVPEIIPVEVGYGRAPLVPAYGPYTWDFLEKINLLQSGNVLIERNPTPENAQHLADWRRQGKKVLAYYNVTWLKRKYDPVTTDAVVAEWSGPSSRGFHSPDYDGIVIDEWASMISPKEYVSFAEAIRKIAANPKFHDRTISPYGGGRFGRERAKPAVKACIDSGYKTAENMYIAEQPNEKAAIEVLNDRLRRNMLLYSDAFPDDDYARHMIMNLGFLSGPPESSDIYPGVDYKVYLDMQMNQIANDPSFFGLYGFQWYHIGYVDEEVLRWAARLLRHYCIEGNRDRLTADPYLLPHITNPDFSEGVAGWTVKSAEDDSVSVRWMPGYGYLQGRTGLNVGDTVLVTRRSTNAPNRISQTIRELTPGRAYSVTMFITDYQEYRSGKSADQPHHASVRLKNVNLLPENSFRVVFGSGLCGHEYGPFDRENQLYITYRRDVFRARSETADLTISDWTDDQNPEGPVGRNLAFNFIQVQPYLAP